MAVAVEDDLSAVALSAHERNERAPLQSSEVDQSICTLVQLEALLKLCNVSFPSGFRLLVDPRLLLQELHTLRV